MVNLHDHILELAAQKISQCWHQPLEASKINAAGQGMAQLKSLDRKALTDRNRKGVHRETHGNDKKLC